MSDFKTRLLEERGQLQEKVTKLDTFIDSDTFGTISELQQELLMDQLYHMSEYLTILDERIEDLDNN